MKKPLLLILAYAAIGISLFEACAKLPLEQAGDTPLTTYFTGFEDSALGKPWHLESKNGQGFKFVHQPVDDDASAGGDGNSKTALSVTVTPSDIANHGVRNELAIYNTAPYKSTVRYRWSFMLDSSYIYSHEWQVLMQFHDLPDWYRGESWDWLHKNHPPLGLFLIGDTLMFLMHTPGNEKTIVGRKVANRGIWYHCDLRVHWALDNNAYQIFVIGSKISGKMTYDTLTLKTGANSGTYFRPNMMNRGGSYFKLGLYRAPTISTTNTLYFDNVSIEADGSGN